MIVSLHIPKTAGKSFRLRLEALYGSRLLSDYGDWIGLDTPEAHAPRAEQAAKMHARRDEILRDYDIIYGQFIADKYAGQFPTVAFTAPAARKAIDTHRAADVELYCRACERFTQRTARYNV